MPEAIQSLLMWAEISSGDNVMLKGILFSCTPVLSFAFRYSTEQFQCLVFLHSSHFGLLTGDENKLLVKNEK